ncbi:MAG: hypothetical protein ABI688_00780 [Bacteroidota bacterium]
MKLKTTNKLFVIVCIAVFLTACAGKSNKAKEASAPADAAKAPTTDTAVASTAVVKLICKDMGTDSLATPHFDVLLSENGTERKIKSINACGEITKAAYKTYTIPAEAIAACGGWWAGAGDYYYVVLRNGKPVVFEGWQDESQKEKGYHWKEITVK